MLCRDMRKKNVILLLKINVNISEIRYELEE